MMAKLLTALATLLAIGAGTTDASAQAANDRIIHDAEYYVLERQHGEQWAQDDEAIDALLAEIRDQQGGQPPNILYILIDDIGFGEIGTPYLNYVRGYETPNINDFAEQGLSLMRMYTEPSCTPTRVAFMTGRQPYRSGMGETAVAIVGFGLPDEEVTLAEILSDAGYNTAHIGKWHMGDIAEAYPHNQGFDFAAFPVHQQAQLSLWARDTHLANQTIGAHPQSYDDRFTLDRTLRPAPGAMVTGLEGRRGELAREVHIETGEEWTQQHYIDMNERYQAQALEQLESLAAEDEPFFLQYWPLFPLTFTRSDVEQFSTPNGGTQTESMQQLDGWIGEIMAALEETGEAENTIVIIMGDNGNFVQYQPGSGYSPMIYRGGKGATTEGGVRVDAFMRWPAALEAGSRVGDMIHVADLYTTLARIAGATDGIPTDRIIDGVDQTAMMLLGETHGRRDHVFIYNGHNMAALVKEQYKLHLPGPGENFIIANFYDLYRDPREEHPVSTPVGAWAAAPFGDIIRRHLQAKEQFPDSGPARDVPYSGIENLRPETQALVEEFMARREAIPGAQ